MEYINSSPAIRELINVNDIKISPVIRVLCMGNGIKSSPAIRELCMGSYILNHTSNAKSNRSFNIIYIVSSIVTQFYQEIKHLFMKMKVELHRSIIPF